MLLLGTDRLGTARMRSEPGAHSAAQAGLENSPASASGTVRGVQPMHRVYSGFVAQL